MICQTPIRFRLNGRENYVLGNALFAGMEFSNLLLVLLGSFDIRRIFEYS